MNFFHGLYKRNKKAFVRVSVRVLAIFYLLFLIGYQLQSPTTAYYSNSNMLNGTLTAINDFGETELNSVLESTEVEEKVEEEANEEINENINKEAKEEIVEDINEEANEEIGEDINEEANEEISEDINEEANEEINKDIKEIMEEASTEDSESRE